MASDKASKFIGIIIAVVVLFSIMATLFPELSTSVTSLNDSNRCVADGGVWNVTQTACVTAANHSIAYSYASVPLNSLLTSIVPILVALMVLTIALIKLKTKR